MTGVHVTTHLFSPTPVSVKSMRYYPGLGINIVSAHKREPIKVFNLKDTNIVVNYFIKWGLTF